mgnify:CR=1 FL=1
MKRKARATARPFRPDALTWIDFLVIGAIALTFLAIASTTIGHARSPSDAPNPPPAVSRAAGDR